MCKQRRSSVSRSIRFNVARPSNIIIAFNHMRSESIVMYRCIWHEDRERKRTHVRTSFTVCVCIHFINIFPNQLHLIYFPTFNIHISLWIFRTSLGFCFINHIFFCPNVFMFCLFVCFSPLHWHIQRKKNRTQDREWGWEAREFNLFSRYLRHVTDDWIRARAISISQQLPIK